jgi:hypothetical protein
MRSWHVIIVSVIAATVIGACWSLPAFPPSRVDLETLVFLKWPGLAVMWLGGFGVVAGALTAIGAVIDSGSHRWISAAGFRSVRGRDARITPLSRLRDYLRQLAISQHYTALVVLCGLGLWQLFARPEEPVFSLAAGMHSTPLRTAAAVVLAGFAGALAVSLAAALFGNGNLATEEESEELRLLRQILELVRDGTLANPPPDLAQCSVTIEQGQRSTLEAIKDVATAVNRLSRGLYQSLGDIKKDLYQAVPKQSVASTSAPLTIEDGTISLQAAVTELTHSVAKLAAVASSLSGDTLLSSASLTQLSTELNELLRTIDEPPSSSQRPIP